jgi:hypothetical protein
MSTAPLQNALDRNLRRPVRTVKCSVFSVFPENDVFNTPKDIAKQSQLMQNIIVYLSIFFVHLLPKGNKQDK